MNFLEYLKTKKHGACCPTCGRLGRIWKYRIHSTIAALLINLYKKGGDKDFVHLEEFKNTLSGNDFGIIIHWGLAISEDVDNPHKRRSGSWKLTQKGVDFVKNIARVPKYALVFNNQCHGFSPEMIGISESLGKHFDYLELLNGE